jgi:hypothetical protein
MSKCVTCGSELHPERAKKYNYCMARECQEKNLKGLTMVAVGVNKSAEQYLILDEDTKEELASGKVHDQRRGSFGPPVSSPGSAAHAGKTAPAGKASPAPAGKASSAPAGKRRAPATPGPAGRGPGRRPWTESQERLALIYNEQGLRPDEIASKLGVSTYLASKIILAARNSRKI